MRAPSIRTKLMLYFLSLLLLSFASLGIISPILYARSIESSTTYHTAQMISQASRGVEFHVREMEKLISFVSLDPNVRAILASGQSGSGSFGSALTYTHDLLANVTQSHPEIAGMVIAGSGNSIVSNELHPVSSDPIALEPWYKAAVEDPHSVHLFARPIGRNLRGAKDYSVDNVVSVVKAIRNAGDGSVLGVVLIDLRLSVIEDLFLDTSVGTQGFLYVADPEGGMVYAPANEIVYRIPERAVSAEPLLFRIKGADYQVIAQKSQYTGWSTVGVFSLDEALSGVNTVRYYSLFILAITLVLAILAAAFFANSIARPVIALQKLMKHAEEGDLTVRFQGKSGDEISRLGRSFNTMIEEIQNLISQVYREQRLQKEAELRMLQEHIKPHFLYNTLDTIQWMAKDHKADDIVSVVDALTGLFRIGLSRGREIISLGDEFKHVSHYLFIQKARYEDKFDYELDLGAELNGYQVLKLILQPLVENSIYHGVKERRGHGTIRVIATIQGDALVLAVEDDGVGMAPEKLAEINDTLDRGNAAKRSQGYGIFNVHERIRLAFGAPYGLHFESRQGAWTRAVLLHPLLKEDAL